MIASTVVQQIRDLLDEGRSFAAEDRSAFGR